MVAATQGPEFTPPPEPGLLRSVGLALLAHAVLVLALSWGLKWKRDDNTVAVEAELWSAAVQQAAPKPVEAPPPPPPVVQAPPPPPPAPPQQREAEIAVEREQQRLAQEKARQEQARREEARQEAERQRQLAERKRQQDEARKQEQAKKATEERKRAEQTIARERREQEEKLAKLREENMKRIQGMAGATGAPESTGTALQSSGPSSSYGGRIRARVKPNIVFTDDIQGNPAATVIVQLAPDGTITGKRLTKTSGVKTWDDAVLRALDRTEVFPRDIDGRVPPSVELVFRPRD
jgi:colicin import membrane protein